MHCQNIRLSPRDQEILRKRDISAFSYFMGCNVFGSRGQFFRCHYYNTPMQYTVIFHCCKNANLQIKILIIFLFLLKT